MRSNLSPDRHEAEDFGKAGEQKQLKFIWTPGHVHEGNQIADKLAKGSSLSSTKAGN